MPKVMEQVNFRAQQLRDIEDKAQKDKSQQERSFWKDADILFAKEISERLMRERYTYWNSNIIVNRLRADNPYVYYPVVDWQPIDTAPAGGQHVLLYANGHTFEAYWNECKERWLAVSPFVHEEGNYYGFIDDPQAWMPLRKPPTE